MLKKIKANELVILKQYEQAILMYEKAQQNTEN